MKRDKSLQKIISKNLKDIGKVKLNSKTLEQLLYEDLNKEIKRLKKGYNQININKISVKKYNRYYYFLNYFITINFVLRGEGDINPLLCTKVYEYIGSKS